VCKFACLLHNPSTADYRKWLAPGACFDLGCRCGPKAVGGEGVVGAIEEGMAADCVLYDLSAFSLLPRADPVVSLVLSSARPTIGAPQVHSVFVRVSRHDWGLGCILLRVPAVSLRTGPARRHRNPHEHS